MDSFKCKSLIDEIDSIINNTSQFNKNILPIFTLEEPDNPNILDENNLSILQKMNPLSVIINLPPNYKNILVEYLVQNQLESLSLSFEETQKLNYINQNLNTIIYLFNRSQFFLETFQEQTYRNQYNMPYLISLLEENEQNQAQNQNIRYYLSTFKELVELLKNDVSLDFDDENYNDLNQYQRILLNKTNTLIDWIDNVSVIYKSYPNINFDNVIQNNDIKTLYDSVLVIYNFSQIIFYIICLEHFR